ncbi:MAG: hypothetical protein IJY09_06095 [Lachnospiraceae bacterium]|nr:hypothetical protein [Lachnospiraceae bacterium]
MGKVILCVGREAEQPYVLQTLNVSIRNMEELCYMIYRNPTSIQEELFRPELYEYIGAELGMPERAAYLKELLHTHAGAKDMMVAIFCSTDYYSEAEIKAVLAEYDAYFQLKPVERRKRDADRMLREKRWQEASAIYQDILDSEDVLELKDADYGKLLHNLAVLEAHGGNLKEASKLWRDAYERSREEESLKQYLLALKLLGKEKLLDQELKFFMPRRELIEQMQKDLYLAREAAERTPEYRELERLRELYEQGKIKEYYQGMDALLERLKQQCRECMQL